MRSGSRPTPEWTRLLCVDGTVSPMICPADGQQNDAKRGQTEDKPRWGQRQSLKNGSRRQRSGGLSLNWYLLGASRWCGVIFHDISRYIMISYPLSCDNTRYDVSRYSIYILNVWDWYRGIASRRSIAQYRTRCFAPLGAPSFGAPRD